MTTNSPTVAVLGTGIMGTPMARNLVRAGLAVSVWNRSRAKAEPLAADGARVAGGPAEAVRGAGVVLTMLHDAEAVLDVMRQAAPGLEPGAVWVQSTTAGLDALDDFAAFAAEQRITFVDAPVLGTKAPAEAGALTVLAAGPEAVRSSLAPVFEAIGSRTVWLDGEGAASRLKLVLNSWVLTVTHGTAEALALAKGLGVEAADFLDAVAGGPLDMGYLRAKAGLVLKDALTPPSFATTTAEKDARLIVAAGERAGVRMDVAAAGAERFRRAVAQGHGEEDMAASYFASFTP
ncbi:NAD(P)-dependent oxidoreductase [Streptomyces sp. AV19]|uniref:NAD(P)-dependent oxidoreductase n=1 Tax=Streptomyces sp. AV19 TaxID=2793068 RepID=UPI0018FECE29|nr:NAD(P)-dependent oxidoreductase [Streptomyces sp. AV19]MBH1933347.1 NAD(P)-dependent oxidoreductase [Streptomyces sp. AV19]MDG4531958.1 NAD(P)-dependent oxidoreductase [Streptomyces sp. AV19]